LDSRGYDPGNVLRPLSVIGGVIQCNTALTELRISRDTFDERFRERERFQEASGVFENCKRCNFTSGVLAVIQNGSNFHYDITKNDIFFFKEKKNNGFFIILRHLRTISL